MIFVIGVLVYWLLGKSAVSSDVASGDGIGHWAFGIWGRASALLAGLKSRLHKIASHRDAPKFSILNSQFSIISRLSFEQGFAPLSRLKKGVAKQRKPKSFIIHHSSFITFSRGARK
ncbi:hypothetical protein [Nitratifractor sp.]